MATNSELVALARRRLYPNNRPAPIVFVRGRGCELFDADGRRYLDLCAGVAVCSVGHGHPALARAIASQAASLMHVSNYFYNEPNIRLGDELCRRTGYDRVFVCNSGAEANEALLKLARHHHYLRGDKDRVRVIAFENAFHGRTLGALSMTGTAKYREGFGPLGPVTHVAYGDAGAVERAMGPDVCAIIVEPVQGEGGVVPAPAGFLATLGAIAAAHGALLLIDEVQTGVGRLGRFLGSDGASAGSGVRGHAVALAKGLGGGFPVGAMLTTEEVAGALPPGSHGATFGGNALACAAALAVLQIIDEERLVEAARTKGEVLGAMLRDLARDLPEVCEGARGEGLLWGVVLKPGLVPREILPRVQQAGVLLTASGERVLRFCPPLIVSIAELEEGVRALRTALEGVRSTL